MKTARWRVTPSSRCYSWSRDMEVPAVGMGGSIRNSAVPTSQRASVGILHLILGLLSVCLLFLTGHLTRRTPLCIGSGVGSAADFWGILASSEFDVIMFCLLSHWGPLLTSAGQMMLCCLLVTIYPFTCCPSALNKLVHSKLKA